MGGVRYENRPEPRNALKKGWTFKFRSVQNNDLFNLISNNYKGSILSSGSIIITIAIDIIIATIRCMSCFAVATFVILKRPVLTDVTVTTMG